MIVSEMIPKISEAVKRFTLFNPSCTSTESIRYMFYILTWQLSWIRGYVKVISIANDGYAVTCESSLTLLPEKWGPSRGVTYVSIWRRNRISRTFFQKHWIHLEQLGHAI